MSGCGTASHRHRSGGVMPSLWIAVAATGLTALVPLSGHTAQPEARAVAGVHTVIIESLHFSPQRLVISRGQRIKWTNEDPFPHTVTATNGSFDSHAIAPGASWTYVASKAGEYDYICTFHPTMKGVIVVR